MASTPADDDPLGSFFEEINQLPAADPSEPLGQSEATVAETINVGPPTQPQPQPQQGSGSNSLVSGPAAPPSASSVISKSAALTNKPPPNNAVYSYDESGSSSTAPSSTLYSSVTVAPPVPSGVVKAHHMSNFINSGSNSGKSSSSSSGNSNFQFHSKTSTEVFRPPLPPSSATSTAASTVSVSVALNNPNKKFVRKAADEVWIDDTLNEWPANDYRIFVGDLAKEISTEDLSKPFQVYPSFAKAKVSH